MNFQQFMKENKPKSIPRYKRIRINDKISFSIQAGRFYHSLPEEDLPEHEYTHFEVIVFFCNKVVPIDRYLNVGTSILEWENRYNGYGYDMVPVDLIDKLFIRLLPQMKKRTKHLKTIQENTQRTTLHRSSDIKKKSIEKNKYTKQSHWQGPSTNYTQDRNEYYEMFSPLNHSNNVSHCSSNDD